jgi:hypothetical protein
MSSQGSSRRSLYPILPPVLPCLLASRRLPVSPIYVRHWLAARRHQPDTACRLPVPVAPADAADRPGRRARCRSPLGQGLFAPDARRPHPSPPRQSQRPRRRASPRRPGACVRACGVAPAAGAFVLGKVTRSVCLACHSLALLQGAILLVADSGCHVVRLCNASTGAALGVSFGGFGVGDGRLRFPFALAARDDGAPPLSLLLPAASIC